MFDGMSAEQQFLTVTALFAVIALALFAIARSLNEKD